MDWLEILLQGLLFRFPLVQSTRRIRKATPPWIKAASLIDRKQIKLVRNKNKTLPAEPIPWKTQMRFQRFPGAEYQYLEANCANWF